MASAKTAADLLFKNHHYCFMRVNVAFEGIDHKFNAFVINTLVQKNNKCRA
jgi:hypothetical protein